MPAYTHRSTTLEGEIIEGVIDARDERSAIERLKKSGFIPLKIAAPRGKSLLSPLRFRSSKTALLTFTTELGALLAAGLPLDRSLSILSEMSESADVGSVVGSILQSIRQGSAFSESLQAHPAMFPKFYVNMIRAGEAGGVLDEVLEKLGDFLETSNELRDHIVSTMIYPVILLLTGGLSVVFLMTYVLPRFSTLFKEMGGALPLPTQVLLAVSNALQASWPVLLLLIASAWAAAVFYIRTPAGQLAWDGLKLRWMGDMIRKLETARFCRTLGTLLRSGVPLLPALNNARDVVGNRVIVEGIDVLARGAKEGQGISAPLAGVSVFPPLAVSMIKVGEETGQLDTMLLKVATTYEKSLKTAINRLVSFLEPAMILGMGLVIGFIVIAMLMAVFSVTDLPF